MKWSIIFPQRRLWITLTMFLVFCPLVWSQAVVSCSSDDMGYHTCNIGPNHGVRLVRQHSDAACILGQTYGVRGEQMWVNRGCRGDFEVMSGGRGDRDHRRNGYDYDRNQNSASRGIVACSSNDMRRHFCLIPPNSRVRVARQRSDAQCIEGRTWGVQGNQLWVDRGCRADFEVLSGGGREHDRDWDRDRDRDRDHDRGNGYGYSEPGGRIVTCSSDDMHRHTCDVGANSGIRLVRQRSDARCELNRTYGFRRNEIWVDRGCRADFEVLGPRTRPYRYR